MKDEIVVAIGTTTFIITFICCMVFLIFSFPDGVSTKEYIYPWEVEKISEKDIQNEGVVKLRSNKDIMVKVDHDYYLLKDTSDIEQTETDGNEVKFKYGGKYLEGELVTEIEN